MRKIIVAVICGVFLLAQQASADGMNRDGIMVEQAWARATAGPAKAGAAYMTLINMGKEADRLVDVQSELAARTEIHTHLMESGIMRMRRVDGVEIAPGTTEILQPGGLHIMFMGLKAPFKEGQELPLTLVFEKAGRIDITFEVQGVGTKSMPQGHNMHKHGS
ncbi:copper chaperone PCu(A)C [Thalassospiraceae bacterium LMO-JJ14]|nr:copper chaperone PCu(A)C [Thalassospiraceae bacterium LMO-JJ14]